MILLIPKVKDTLDISHIFFVDPVARICTQKVHLFDQNELIILISYFHFSCIAQLTFPSVFYNPRPMRHSYSLKTYYLVQIIK